MVQGEREQTIVKVANRNLMSEFKECISCQAPLTIQYVAIAV